METYEEQGRDELLLIKEGKCEENDDLVIDALIAAWYKIDNDEV